MLLSRTLTVLLALLLAQPTVAASRADASYEEARRAYYAFRADAERQKLRHHWRNVAALFDRVAKAHPGSDRAPEALYTAGLLYEELSLISRLPEDLEDATGRFRQLVERHGAHRLADDGAVHLARILLERREDPVEARRWVDRALASQSRGDQAAALRALQKRLPAPVVTAARPKPKAEPPAPAVARAAPKAQETAPARESRVAAASGGKPTTTAAAGKPKVAAAAGKRAQAPAPGATGPARSKEVPSGSAEHEARERRQAAAEGERPATARAATSHVIPRADDAATGPVVAAVSRQARRVGTLNAAARPALAADLDDLHEEEAHDDDHLDEVEAAALAGADSGDDALAEAFRRVTPAAVALSAEAAADSAEEGEGLVAAVSRFARKDAPRLFTDKEDEARREKAARQRLASAAAANDSGLSLAEQLGLKVRRIVIDAGHGGHDSGAIGKGGTKEKDVALSISLELAKLLRKQGLEVVLTRSDDRYLKLEERSQLANRAEGDLFISVHCNAAVSRRLRGVETYTLNLSSDRYAIRLAARENASSEKGVSDLQYILADLATKANTGDSTRLAKHVQGRLVSDLRGKYQDVRNLGHKEALFYVLLGARMPAILVETSFISNPEEEKRLASRVYQQRVAAAIAAGVEDFLGDRARLAKVD